MVTAAVITQILVILTVIVLSSTKDHIGIYYDLWASFSGNLQGTG